MRRREELLDRIRPKLVCPSCRIALDDHIDGSRTRSLRCASCGLTARRDRGAFHFQGLSDETQKQDWLNTVKAKAKHRLGRFYPLAIDALGPVYGEPGAEPFVATFDSHEIVCDLGSGTCTFDQVVAIDGYAYDNVHVICDLAALPFADGTIDGIISQAVLEHVPDPAAHEIGRASCRER